MPIKQKIQQLPIWPASPFGMALQNISADGWGWALFPGWGRVKVHAIEDVRLHKRIMIVNTRNRVTEASPEEIKFEKADKTWQRVTELKPFPVTAGSRAVDYATITATASGNTTIVTPASGKKIRVHYFSYSNAHTADITVGMRFGANGTIRHKAYLVTQGGNFNANLIDACWEGAVDEPLIANLSAAASGGIEITVGYTSE